MRIQTRRGCTKLGHSLRWRPFGAALCCALALQACAAFEEPSLRDARSRESQLESRARVSHTELQGSVERFLGHFTDNLIQAASEVDRDAPDKQQVVLRQVLVYGSSALDIVSGPLPEVNVLDLLVFVVLCRQALESYWVPKVLGQDGQRMVATFASAETSLWKLSDSVLSAAQRGQLRAVIEAWRAAHPDQIRVEWVRLQDFAFRADEVAQAQAAQARGLLSSVRRATQAADRALSLGERAMFVAHRLPFLIRLQARLGVQESLGDTQTMLRNLPALVAHVPELSQLVRDGTQLSTHASEAARETRLLFESVEPLLHSLELIRVEDGGTARAPGEEWARLSHLLAASNQLAETSLELVRQLREATSREAELGARLDALVWRWLGYLALLGACWSALFWGGYYLAKRALQRLRAAGPGDAR